uniref:Myb-like domain-containing protein n=1 Tax=Brassica oleracea var. oleracea TaxID=109376 RepID=A0A0D3DCP4_BRAOL
MNLLFSQSQTPVDLDSPETFWFGSQGPSESVVEPVVESVVESGVRRKWSPKEDKILIGAWLNTSKDPVVSNEQKAGAFWKRIVDYYNASPQLVGTVPREVTSCKQRWGRINTDVSKFAGCYDAALREQRSGQNDDDVMKAALDIFFSNNDEDATFSSHLFRRRFRMNKELFFRLVHVLSYCFPFFQQRRDATGRFGLSALQKCTEAIRMLAYGSAADTVDEYLRLGETTALSCLHNFTDGIIQLFGIDVTRSSQVETERPTNLNNMFPNRNDLRDRHMHDQLKNDLIQIIWNKFGDED